MVCLLFCALPAAAEDVYLTQERFLQDAFGTEPPAKQTLWLTESLRPAIKDIMGHRYPLLRAPYWQQGNRTAWVLEEIGKYKPITTGLVVEGDALVSIQVLVYRESHGWEVKRSFFTDQFKGLQLEDEYELSSHIDGISGATLSVNALTRLAKLALFLHQQVMHGSAS